MTAYKKHKIEDKCHVFNEEWTVKYCFMKVGNKAICMLCGESVTVFKEYNLKRHNQTKHAYFGENFYYVSNESLTYFMVRSSLQQRWQTCSNFSSSNVECT